MKRFKCFAVVLLVSIHVLSFNVISAVQNKVGDVNGDDIVNSTDYSLMKRFLLNTIDDFPVQDVMWVADVNGDGYIDSTDYALMKRYILGIIEGFPKNESTIPTPTLPPTSTPEPEHTPTPVITSVITPETSPSNNEPYPGWDKMRSGYATYTGSGYEGGIALLDPIPADMEIAAVNKPEYNSFGVQAALAGAYLEVTGPRGTTVVYVTDCYTEAFEGALDLCRISCDKLGDTNVPGGKIDLEWRVIAAPITGNFTYRVLPGSSKWWLALQVRNHKYPIMKMEYYDNGEWINLPKDRCNYFVINNLSTLTPKIRITDIRGKVVTDVVDSIPEDFEENCLIPGNSQFPD